MKQQRLKFVLPALLIFSILGASAIAGLAALPESQFTGLRISTYQGVKLVYCVYDTELAADALKIDAPGEGRYIYAYQIFNEYNSSGIEFLSLQGIEEGAIKSTSDVGSVESDGGIAPTDRFLNAEATVATYEFGNGAIEVGENSWFLTIRSDGKPKAGTFTFQPPTDGDVLIPGPGDSNPIPEPLTLSLMLLGAGAVLKKSKK